MGDNEGAIGVLQEVLRDGDKTQKNQADKLLSTLTYCNLQAISTAVDVSLPRFFYAAFVLDGAVEWRLVSLISN
jgi:FimV-like protein